MFTYQYGNLLEAKTDAVVTSVNTIGFMSKGVAHQMKLAFPHAYRNYVKDSKQGKIQIGKMHIVPTQMEKPRYVINFPVRLHWHSTAQIEFIIAGLEDLVQHLKALDVKSVSIPALGCGSGGLDWFDVHPKIIEALSPLKDIEFHIYQPHYASTSDEDNEGLLEGKMTKNRALLVYLVEQYRRENKEISYSELQKLVYFLQEAGEPLRLRFSRKQNGPYAENLNRLLQRMDVYFHVQQADRQLESKISLVDGAAELALEVLNKEPKTLHRVESVGRFVKEIHTRHDLELLSNIQWFIKYEKVRSSDILLITDKIYAMGDAYKLLFDKPHIERVWRYLLASEMNASTPTFLF